jgi:Metal-dependent hydrolases of the beta-lactamase superfamily III
MPGPTTLKYGGNTSCQEIRVGGRLLIFDAGTGIISLGQELAKEGPDHNIALFFSHNHHDHTGGMLYFKPAYNPGTTLHIFGPREERGTILDALDLLSTPAVHPVHISRMGMKYTCATLDDGDAVVWSPGDDAPRIASSDAKFTPDDVVVRVLHNSLHPVDGVLNFRLEYAGKAYVYATDVEGDEEKGDPGLAAFAKDANLMAHDGQYTSEEYESSRRGWGHSTVRMAIKTAQMAGVQHLAIIHHEPTYSDDQLDAMEREGKALFPGVFLAREGQEVII